MSATQMGSGPGSGMGAPSVSMMVLMMAAMMAPSAGLAIAQRGREWSGAIAAPLFAGPYLGIWALIGLAVGLVYQRPGAVPAGALIVVAGVYELTPLKRECRQRCRARVDSGVRLGVHCLGSSIGLMAVLVAVDVMSIPLMVSVAAVVLAQKLIGPHPAIDIPLALAIVGLGVVTAAT